MAMIVMGVGVRSATVELPAAGGLLAVGCFVWAALLEFQANRRAARIEGEPGGMGMLPYSSDWPAIMRRGRGRR